MFEWSDDDEVPMAPQSSTKAPPRNMRAEEQSRGGEGVPEQQATGVPEQQAEEVPERRAEQRPTMEEAGPPPQSTEANPIATPGGLGRHRQFKKLYRQTKP